jgi:hypothetical protein
LASAGAGISAIYGLAIAMASTLGGIDQMGTLRRVAPGAFAKRVGAGASSTRTVARHRNDVRADNRVPFAPPPGTAVGRSTRPPGELWRSCGKVRAAPVEIRGAREGTELGRSPRPRRMCATRRTHELAAASRRSCSMRRIPLAMLSAGKARYPRCIVGTFVLIRRSGQVATRASQQINRTLRFISPRSLQ